MQNKEKENKTTGWVGLHQMRFNLMIMLDEKLADYYSYYKLS